VCFLDESRIFGGKVGFFGKKSRIEGCQMRNFLSCLEILVIGTEEKKVQEVVFWSDFLE